MPSYEYKVGNIVEALCNDPCGAHLKKGERCEISSVERRHGTTTLHVVSMEGFSGITWAVSPSYVKFLRRKRKRRRRDAKVQTIAG